MSCYCVLFFLVPLSLEYKLGVVRRAEETGEWKNKLIKLDRTRKSSVMISIWIKIECINYIIYAVDHETFSLPKVAQIADRLVWHCKTHETNSQNKYLKLWTSWQYSHFRRQILVVISVGRVLDSVSHSALNAHHEHNICFWCWC